MRIVAGRARIVPTAAGGRTGRGEVVDGLGRPESTPLLYLVLFPLSPFPKGHGNRDRKSASLQIARLVSVGKNCRVVVSRLSRRVVNHSQFACGKNVSCTRL